MSQHCGDVSTLLLVTKDCQNEGTYQAKIPPNAAIVVAAPGEDGDRHRPCDEEDDGLSDVDVVLELPEAVELELHAGRVGRRESVSIGEAVRGVGSSANAETLASV